MESVIAAIEALCKQAVGLAPDRIEKLPQSGSDRIYFSVRPYLRINQPCFAALFTITELVLMRKRYAQDDYRQVNVFGLKP